MRARKYIKLYLAILSVSLVSAFVLFNQHAFAAGSRFLGPDNGSSDMRLGLYAADGSSVLLDAPQTKVRVFKPINNNGGVEVKLTGICSSGKPIIAVVKGQTKARSPNNCQGGDLEFNIPGNDLEQLNRYGPKWKSQLITISFDGNQAPAGQSFTVDVSNDSKVTFEDLGSGNSDDVNSSLSRPSCDNPTEEETNPSTIRNRQNGCKYPRDNAFSVKPDSGNDNTFKLTFSPDCQYDGTSPVFLKWFDADVGTSYGGSNQRFRLIDKSDGGRVIANVSGKGQLGGEGSFAYERIDHLDKGHVYEWEWTGITSGNGVQIWVPFSEIFTSIKCDEPPDGNLTVLCGQNGLKVSGVGDEDSPQGGTSIRLRVRPGNDPNGWVTVYNSESQGGNNIKGSRSFNWPDGFPKQNNHVELIIRNYQPGGGIGDNNDPMTKVIDKSKSCGEPNNESSCRTISFNMPSSSTRNNNEAVGNGEYKYAVWVNDVGTTAQPTRDFQSGGVYDAPLLNNGDSPPDYRSENQNRNDAINIDLREQRKIVSGQLRYTIVKYTTYRNSNGASKMYVFERTPVRTVDGCYVASCNVEINNLGFSDRVRGASSNDVEANEDFEVTVTLTNQGQNRLPSWLNIGNNNYIPLTAGVFPGNAGWSPDVYDYNYWGVLYSKIFDPGLDPGETTEPYTFKLHAPNSIGIHRVSVMPDYYGGDSLGNMNGSWNPSNEGATCGPNVNVFKRFDFTPTAAVNLDDDEDPTNANFNLSATNPDRLTYPTIRYNAVSVFVPTGGAPQILNQVNSGSINPSGNPINIYNYNHSPSSPKAGDKYCLFGTIENKSGWVGPWGVQRGVTSGTDYDCDTVSNHPYLRAYGGDVSAGGGYSQTGGCTVGEINTYTRTTNGGLSTTRSGSGVQFAAMAIQAITGFTSASLRNVGGEAQPPLGLTFANQDISPTAGTSAPLGGNFTGWCPTITDYYGSTIYNEGDRRISQSLRDINSSTPGQTHLTGSQTIGGFTVTSQRAVYVEGDVYINGNIVYGPNGATIASIPNFALIVKGNIYIAPNVTQLDGLYVAQPKDDGSGGIISTCASGIGNNLVNFTSCATELRVNGAFIADYIHFLRTKNSLRDSASREPANSSNAAEIFNLNPEMYLARPAFRQEGGSSTGVGIPDYQYITTLPPIL